MNTLWRVVCEMCLPRGTRSDNNGSENTETLLGFANWITWAETSDEAQSKVRKVSSEYGWTVLNIELTEAVGENEGYDEDLSSMVEDAYSNEKNEQYCAIGTLHTYPAS